MTLIDVEIAGDFPPGGKMTILHTMRFCAFTTLFLVQCIILFLSIHFSILLFEQIDDNPNAQARSVVNVIKSLPLEDFSSSFVYEARSRVMCPPGRMGATCDYFSEIGWQRESPSDGMGGYIQTADSGGHEVTDVYLLFLLIYNFWW